MVEDVGDSAEQPKAVAGPSQTIERNPLWVYLLVFDIVLSGMLPTLSILASNNIFKAPQIVYDGILFILFLNAPLLMAVLLWKGLRTDPKLRNAWEAWPIAGGAVIALSGCLILLVGITLKVLNVFSNLFPLRGSLQQFIGIVLLVTICAFGVVQLSAAALELRLRISGLVRKRHAHLGNDT